MNANDDEDMEDEEDEEDEEDDILEEEGEFNDIIDQ